MNDKVKVLLISPYKGTVGGISRWTGHILEFYKRKGHDDVHLEQFYGRNEETHIVHGGDSVVKRFILGIGSYLPLVKDVKTKLKTGNYDILHICSSGSYGLVRDWLLLKAAKRHAVKTVIHFRFGRIPALLNQKGWESSLLNKVLTQTDRIVVLDKATLSALTYKGYTKVQLIPNLVSIKLEDAIRKCSSCNRASRTVLFVGHAIESKGIYELIKAVAQMSDMTLRIVGFAPEATKTLANECFGNSASNVVFVGELSYEETIKEMLTCTVLSLPSYSEGFPNVILEGMACGCSIVATPVGAIPEMFVINGENPCGVCVPVGDVAELRESINELINNPTKAKTLGENARKRVNEVYSMPKVWELLVGMWNSL